MRSFSYFILTKSVGLYLNLLSYLRPKQASHLAYRFFSEPRRGKLIPEKLPRVLQSAKHELFESDGQSFQAYIWAGGEETILLIHGWESNAARWARLLPYLRKSGRTVIALDGPAHGLSAGREFNIPTYAAFIDLAVKKYNPQYMIGHSMGGAACVFYQYKFQHEGLRKMVLLGSPSDLKTLIDNYVKLLSLSTRTTKLLENYFIERFKFGFADFSGSIFGKELKIPGLIAHDIEDTVVAFEESKKIAASWINAAFVETRGLGHSMHDYALYRQIIQFLSPEKQA
jgi:predicted alpha/beta hydrolase family esterase